MKKIVRAKTAEELRLLALRAQFAYAEAEEKRLDQEVLPELRKLVGQCYKYRNSYGGGLSRWWLYGKVLSVNEKTCEVHTIEFQHTSMERIEIELDKKTTYRGRHFMKDGSYMPATNAEYNKAKKSLKRFVIEKLEL